MNPLLKDRFSYNNGMIIRIDKTLFTENMKHEFFHILKTQTGEEFDEKNYHAFSNEYEDIEQDIGIHYCICGQLIKKLCTIQYKDGTTFQVGNECIEKISERLKAEKDNRVCCSCGSIYDKRGRRAELKLCKSCFEDSSKKSLKIIEKFQKQKEEEKEEILKLKKTRLDMLKHCKLCKQLNINKLKRHRNICYICVDIGRIKYIEKLEEYEREKREERQKREEEIKFENEMIAFDYHDTFHMKEIIKKHGGEWNSNEKKWYIKRKNYNSLFNEIKDLTVPFDPPMSFEEFLKKDKSYIDKIIRLAKTKNTEEEWNIFLIQINKIYK